MSVTADRRALFEQLVRDADYWIDRLLESTGGRFAPTEADRIALRAALFDTIAGFLHSMFVNIDGGGRLADTARVDLVAAGGESLGPALHELFFEYLAEIDRLPA